MIRPAVVRPIVIALAAILLAPAAARATRPSSQPRAPYSVEILVDGVPLAHHPFHGKTYVEARRGVEYSVRMTNRTGERIAVALSVDGLNSIDAERSTARAASKWILAPYQSIVVDGWQTSSSTARKFFFTSEESSYGAWLGETSNLGVISAAFFRERRPVARLAPPAPPRRPTSSTPRSKRSRGEAGPSVEPSPETRREVRNRAAEAGKAELDAEAFEDSSEMAATGIGREVGNRVTRVSFEAERSPATVIDLRYEYRDALVRLGVLSEPFARDERLSRRERARGFEDTGFAPDPYRP